QDRERCEGEDGADPRTKPLTHRSPPDEWVGERRPSASASPLGLSASPATAGKTTLPLRPGRVNPRQRSPATSCSLPTASSRQARAGPLRTLRSFERLARASQASV